MGTIQGTDINVSGTITLTQNPVGSTYDSNNQTVTELFGTVHLNNTSGSVYTLSLTSPTSGTDDGKILTVMNFHGGWTLSPSGGVIYQHTNGTGSVNTITIGSVGDVGNEFMTLMANGGLWYVMASWGVSFS